MKCRGLIMCTASVTVTGIGNYTGKGAKEFSIEPKSIEENMFSVPTSPLTATGKAQKPSVKGTYNGRTLAEGVDYRVDEYRYNTDVGTGYVIVTGIGDYEGTVWVPFEIIARELSDGYIDFSKETMTFTGDALDPGISVYYNGELLDKDLNYRLYLSNNIHAGSGTIRVEGIGYYTGSISKSFTISSMQLTASMFTVPSSPLTATGKELKPSVSGKNGNIKLYKGTDYRIEGYQSNTKAGTGYVIVSGLADYTGTIMVPFEIKAKKDGDSGQDSSGKEGNDSSGSEVNNEGTGKTSSGGKKEDNITKQPNPMVVIAKTPTVKATKVAKKKQTIKKSKAFTVSNAQGAVSFKKKSGSKKLERLLWRKAQRRAHIR